MATTQTKTAAEQMRVLPALVGAMAAGVVLFGVVTVFLWLTGAEERGGTGGEAAGIPGVMWIALGAVTLAGVVGFIVVGAAARTRARRVWESREDDAAGHAGLVRLLMVSTIARAALAEGFGLFGGVLVLVYGELLPLAVLALGVVMMATLLPAGSRLRSLEEAATGMRGGGYGGA